MVLQTKKFRKRRVSGTKFGGDKRDRTADLLNAIQALSQLSYTPIFDSLLSQTALLLYHSEPKCQEGSAKKYKKMCREKMQRKNSCFYRRYYVVKGNGLSCILSETVNNVSAGGACKVSAGRW